MIDCVFKQLPGLRTKVHRHELYRNEVIICPVQGLYIRCNNNNYDNYNNGSILKFNHAMKWHSVYASGKN